MRELYLLPFELAVRDGGSLGIMTSYNRLNGAYGPDNAELLDGILRGEWGFEGFVVTDWYAQGDTVAAAAPGSTSRCRGRVGSTARSWPRPCATARSTSRWSTRR